MDPPKYSLWDDLTEDVIGQLWAEAVMHYRNRLPLVLPTTLNNDLLRVQDDYKVKDEWQGLIESFLEKKLPSNWYDLTAKQRRAYFANEDMLSAEGVLVRSSVSTKEILNECVDLGVINDNDRRSSLRVSACMKKVDGWIRAQKLPDKGYGRQRGWIREIVECPDVETTDTIFQ